MLLTTRASCFAIPLPSLISNGSSGTASTNRAIIFAVIAVRRALRSRTAATGRTLLLFLIIVIGLVSACNTGKAVMPYTLAVA